MAKTELLVIIAFAALVCSTEVDDADQKKRGTAKGSNINSIPSGAQKQDYTYSIYSQNPSSQSVASSPSYQSQAPNSFYPNQANQYYTPSNTQTDTSSQYGQQYTQQPQINLLSPSSQPFVPINFVSNTGYQSKYQLVPSQSKGNIQLAILQQPNSFPTQPVYPSSFPQNLFSVNPTSPQQSFLGSLPSPGQFNVAPNFPYSLGNSLGNSYLGQPSGMVVLAQPNPFSNYPQFNSPGQNLFHNYFATSNQPKFGISFTPQGSYISQGSYVPQGSYAPQGSSDIQASALQNIPKEDNEISGANTSEYTSAPSDANASYKSSYSPSRSSYLKI